MRTLGVSDDGCSVPLRAGAVAGAGAYVVTLLAIAGLRWLVDAPDGVFTYSPDRATIVLWTFFDAHGVPIEVWRTADVWRHDVLAPESAAVPAIRLLPFAVLFVAGALVARSARTDEPGAGALAGATVTAGYLPLVLASLAAGTVVVSPLDVAQPSPSRGVLLAGLGYPLAAGALGGRLAVAGPRGTVAGARAAAGAVARTRSLDPLRRSLVRFAAPSPRTAASAGLLAVGATFTAIRSLLTGPVAADEPVEYLGSVALHLRPLDELSAFEVAVWLFYQAHFVPLEGAVSRSGEPLYAGLLLTGSFRVHWAVFAAIPAASLLLAGAVLGVRATDGPADARRSTLAGASVVLGYAPVVAVGALTLHLREPAPFETGRTVVMLLVPAELHGPALLEAVLLAGVVYPLAFGGLGGYAAARALAVRPFRATERAAGKRH